MTFEKPCAWSFRFYVQRKNIRNAILIINFHSKYNFNFNLEEAIKKTNSQYRCKLNYLN